MQILTETVAENLILTLDSLKNAMVNSKTQQHNSPESTTTHDISDIVAPTIDELTNLMKTSTPKNTPSEADYYFSHQPHKRQHSRDCSPTRKQVREEDSKMMETAPTVANPLSK